jgi:hypothetical protein
MRRPFCLFFALVLLALGAGPAKASCAGRLTEEGAMRASEVVFKGRVLGGPTLEVGGRQVADGFANMHVLEYRKGDGPEVVRVATGSRSQPGGMVLIHAEGINPALDEEWVIYGQFEPDGTVFASPCRGSHPSGQASFDESAGREVEDLVRYQWGWIVSAAFAAGAVGLAMARVARRRRT